MSESHVSKRAKKAAAAYWQNELKQSHKICPECQFETYPLHKRLLGESHAKDCSKSKSL